MSGRGGVSESLAPVEKKDELLVSLMESKTQELLESQIAVVEQSVALLEQFAKAWCMKKVFTSS